MSSPYPPLPPSSSPSPAAPEQGGWREAMAQAPGALRPVVLLLIVNLGLSIVLTVVVALARHSVATFQLDARHITDPGLRDQLRASYTAGIVGRAIGNIVASVVYAFLVRALLRGRRWAYRRVVWLSGFGAFALLSLLLTPYPWWIHAEQVVQAVVLLALLYFVTRPEVRAHFAPELPGRAVGRFGRGR